MNRTLVARWFASGLTILAAWACSAGGKGAADGFGSNTGSGSAGSGNGTGSGGSGNGNGTGSGGQFIVGNGSTTSTDGSATDSGCPKAFAVPEAIQVPIITPVTVPITTPITVPVTIPITTPVTIPVTVPITTTVRGPLDMYIMYDQSGSMGNGNPEKWTAIKNALIGFMNDPNSADVGMGIQYFPLGVTCSPSLSNCFCFCNFLQTGGSCTVSAYATPDVPIQLLPGVATAITNSLNAHGPGGGTPTEPALQGAIQYATQWATAHPTRNGLPLKTVVVLATDGDPNDCSSDVAGVSAIAAAGFNGTPSMQTFVIGVGSSLTSLNSIAAAGGTGQAIIVDTNNNPTQQFINALNSIRDTSTVTGTTTVYVDGGTTTVYVDGGTTTKYVDGGVTTKYVDGGVTTTYTKLPCEWVIPTVPASAGTFDKGLVNVTYNSTTIGFVRDAANCVSGTAAWHYDDYANPTKVMLCPSTCDDVKAWDANAVPNISVYFGCATEEIVQ